MSVNPPVSETADAEDEWESIGAGAYRQLTDEYIVFTADKHIGSFRYAFFTPEQLRELRDCWYDFDDDERFYELTVETTEYDSLRLSDAAGHIVTLQAEQAGDALAAWDEQYGDDEPVDFETYLNEQEYLLSVTNVNEHMDDANGNQRAKVSYHSFLTPEETCGLIEDENVTVDRIDFEDKYVRVVDER